MKPISSKIIAALFLMMTTMTFIIAPDVVLAQTPPTPTTAVPDPGNLFDMFTKSEGDMYSNNLLNQIFGSIFPATGTASSDSSKLFPLVIGYFNAGMLVVAGLLFFSNLATGTMQSAHEGKALGGRWSSMWAPLRVVFAIGLLIPLPQQQNYNTAQLGVGFVVRNATSFASQVWSMAVTNIFSGVTPIAPPPINQDKDMVTNLFMMELCKASLNQMYLDAAGGDASKADTVKMTLQREKMVYMDPNATYVGDDPALMAMSSVKEGDVNRASFSYDRFGPGVGNSPTRSQAKQVGVCGEVKTPSIPAFISNRTYVGHESGSLKEIFGGDTTAMVTIFTNHHEAYIQSIISGRDTATNVQRSEGIEGIVKKVMNQYNTDYKPASEANPGVVGRTGTLDLRADLQRVIEGSNAVLYNMNAKLSELVYKNGQRNKDVTKSIIDRIDVNCQAEETGRACWGEGWIGAGSWYLTIARFNNEIASLYAAQPDASINKDDADGRWFWDFRTRSNEGRTFAEYSKIYDYGIDNFNYAADRLAANGWAVSSSLATNVADMQSGYDVGSHVDRDSLESGLSDYSVSLLKYLANFTFGQDPMVGLIQVGKGMTTIGFTAILADTVVPGNILSSFGATIVTAGATLSIVMPLMPFIFWVMGVTGYFLLVVEAFLAVNLWAISHMRMDGEGISGEAGRKGWLMLLSLMVTPFLMIAGYLVGMIIFRVTCTILVMGIEIAASNIIAGNFIFKVAATMVFAITMVIMFLVVMERSFSLIAEFPDKVMRWIGESVNLDIGDANKVRAGAIAGVGAVNTGAKAIGQGANAVGGRILGLPKRGTSASPA